MTESVANRVKLIVFAALMLAATATPLAASLLALDAASSPQGVAATIGAPAASAAAASAGN